MTGTEQVGWWPLRKPVRAVVPLASTPFGRLAVPHSLSVAGDTLITIALAGSLFFSMSPGAARGRVALSLVLTMAPFALVAPLLGPAIDASRRGRRSMVVASCLGRAACCVAMAAVVDGLLLFPAAFTALVLSKAYSVAKSSLVPSVVDDDTGLVEANSRLAVISAGVGLVAAAPGVAVLRLFGSTWVLRLAAAVFVVGAVRALRIPEVRRQAAAAAERSGDAEVRSAGIVAAAVAMAVLRGLVGFLTFLVAFSFRRAGAPSWWFGVVLAASTAASLAGAALAPRLRSLVLEERILAGCLALVALTGLAVARLAGPLWAVVMATALGLGATAGKVAFDALVQRDAPDAVRGRSFARFETGFQLVWVVGALLPVLISTPLRQGFDVVGLASLAAGSAYVLAGRHLSRAARSGEPVRGAPP